jgi:ABC-type molybdate transport system permease subunit
VWEFWWLSMYEMLVAYKIPLMVMGAVAIGLFALLALLSAWMFQGSTERKVTGPLYSSIICIGVVVCMCIVGEYLIFLSDRLSMAFGLALMVFCVMVLFTVSGLCFAAKTYKKPIKNGFFKVG